MATKEQVIANRTFATERYILSTMPVLYLPLWKTDSGESGDSFISSDGGGHLCTVTGATWGIQGRDFNPATPDWIEIPAAVTQLDFTSGAFSFIFTIDVDDLSDGRTLIGHEITSQTGYLARIDTDGSVVFFTFQTAANQVSISTAGDFVINTRYTVGITRDGASVRLYRNGVDVTNTVGVHIDPVSSASKVYIGIRGNEVDDSFDGVIGTVLAYNRALSAIEHIEIHNRLEWRT